MVLKVTKEEEAALLAKKQSTQVARTKVTADQIAPTPPGEADWIGAGFEALAIGQDLLNSAARNGGRIFGLLGEHELAATEALANAKEGTETAARVLGAIHQWHPARRFINDGISEISGHRTDSRDELGEAEVQFYCHEWLHNFWTPYWEFRSSDFNGNLTAALTNPGFLSEDLKGATFEWLLHNWPEQMEDEDVRENLMIRFLGVIERHHNDSLQSPLAMLGRKNPATKTTGLHKDRIGIANRNQI